MTAWLHDRTTAFTLISHYRPFFSVKVFVPANSCLLLQLFIQMQGSFSFNHKIYK